MSPPPKSNLFEFCCTSWDSARAISEVIHSIVRFQMTNNCDQEDLAFTTGLKHYSTVISLCELFNSSHFVHC